MQTTIVVAIDDSDHSARATQWCADHAAALGAEVVVVHAVEMNYAFGSGAPMPYVGPSLTAAQLDELRDLVASDWCKPLADAGVTYRVVVDEGRPATVIAERAHSEHADLVVCGRRGRGGVAEMLLGSTSHELSHHLKVPMVIVP